MAEGSPGILSCPKTGPVAYLATTFPKLSETFVQREVRGLIKAGMVMELRTIWGGGNDFEGKPVLKFSMWELVGVPFWLGYWLVFRPRVVFGFLGYLFKRPSDYLNAQEMWLGTAYGLLKARGFGKSEVRKVHAAWATMPATAALLIYRLTDIPFSMGAHAYDLFVNGGDGLLPEKVEAATFIQSSNLTARKELAARYPQYVDKLFCVRRCLENFPDFSPRIPKNPEKLSMLSVGRLVPKKGYQYLVDLIAVANQRGLDWSLKIVGDGPDTTALRRKISAYKLEDRVLLLGALDYSRVKEEYRLADAFLFAGIISVDGDRDGLPNVIPEAMAFGLPVFAEANPGVQEAVANEETGWLVSFQDPDEAIDCIEDVFARDSFGPVLSKAYEWVREHFDPEKTTAQLMDLHAR